MRRQLAKTSRVSALQKYGWAQAALGHFDDGIAEIRRSLEGRLPLSRSWRLGMLAECLIRAGDHSAALEAVTEGLERLGKTGERVWESDLRRLRGTLLAQQGAPAGKVEACLRGAVEVARGQGAKSLELRATVSLSRLLWEEGRTGEARRILADLYGGFTEGFETRDLRQAAELLEEMG